MSNKLSLLFGLGIVGILDTIIVISLGNGVNLGILLPAIVGSVIIIAGLAKLELLPWGSVVNRIISNRFIVSGFILFCISFIIVEILIFSGMDADNITEYNYLIVLGGGVQGNKPSLVLQKRLEGSLAYIQNHPELKKIIVTGGQGPLANRPEAKVMKEYLVDQGVDQNKIITEPKASSTMENFKFSKQILDSLIQEEVSQVTVITSEFHLFRSRFLARRNGLVMKGIPAKTPIYILPNLALREYFAIIKSYIFDINYEF